MSRALRGRPAGLPNSSASDPGEPRGERCPEHPSRELLAVRRQWSTFRKKSEVSSRVSLEIDVFDVDFACRENKQSNMRSRKIAVGLFVIRSILFVIIYQVVIIVSSLSDQNRLFQNVLF